MENDVVEKTEEVETRIPRQEELLEEWGLETGDIKQCIKALNKLVDDTPKMEDLAAVLGEYVPSPEKTAQQYQQLVIGLEGMLKQACELLEENDIELPAAVNLWWETKKETTEKFAAEVEQEAGGIKKAIENGVRGGFVRRSEPEGEINDAE